MNKLSPTTKRLSKANLELGDALHREHDPEKKERLLLARMYVRMALQRIKRNGEPKMTKKTLQPGEWVYLVTRRAKMPSTCYGGNNYYRIALMVASHKTLVAEERHEPSMISRRAKGVVGIVEVTPPLWKGQTEKSQFWTEWERLAERMEEIEETRVYQDDPYA